MKYIIIVALAIYANQSSALVIWPGTTAPCNTTLQACLTGSPNGETIEIRTNDIIDERLDASNISLVAGIGYKPIIARNRNLAILGTIDGLTVTISGLTLLRGRISYDALDFGGQSSTLNITNNHIIDSTAVGQLSGPSILVDNHGNHQLNLNISFNQINHNITTTGFNPNGAIAITNGSSAEPTSTGTITGRIYNNRIKAVGAESVGIGLYEYASNSSDLDVSSNELIGGVTAAMYVVKDAGSLGISQLDFAHNAFHSNQVDTIFRGLKANVSDGEIEINVINNTVIGAHEGFNFQQAFGGIIDVNFYNNLIAFTQTAVLINNPTITDSTITFNNDYNLINNSLFFDPDYVAGLNFIGDNPLIKGLNNGRLNLGSPAIEAGNSLFLFLVGSVPLNDADGLVRIKNGNPSAGGVAIDIGAYEAGDFRVLDYFNNTNSHVNTIESTVINAQNSPKLHVTLNFNPGSVIGTLNNSNFGVFMPATNWSIFNQDFVPMNPNAAFNIWSPAPSINSFVHTADDAGAVAESSTLIDKGGMNNNPDIILSVTQLWDSTAGGIYNDNPTGAYYDAFADKWRIVNTNFVDMPLDAKFNVYYQTASANAFEHHSGPANIFVESTFIDHPLLNESPCAQFQVTHVGLNLNPHPIGVYFDYTKNQWGIFNQGSQPMPVGVLFHVIVSAEQIADQIGGCGDNVFADSFE